MLSRTAASLYWVGRYVERAEFTARLIEATIRLDSLSAAPGGRGRVGERAARHRRRTTRFTASGEERSPANVSRYLTLDRAQPQLDPRLPRCRARQRPRGPHRAVAARRGRRSTAPGSACAIARPSTGGPGTLALVETLKAEARGFEGAVHRMLRNESSWFLMLGAAIERADNTARLIDVKYHLLLPEGELVGGVIDRDQWTTILHTVSAVNAYRLLYRDGLKPGLVAELLIMRRELPRSLAASTDEVVNLLNLIGKRTGRQGEADRLARQRQNAMNRTSIRGDLPRRAARISVRLHHRERPDRPGDQPAVPLRLSRRDAPLHPPPHRLPLQRAAGADRPAAAADPDEQRGPEHHRLADRRRLQRAAAPRPRRLRQRDRTCSTSTARSTMSA